MSLAWDLFYYITSHCFWNFWGWVDGLLYVHEGKFIDLSDLVYLPLTRPLASPPQGGRHSCPAWPVSSWPWPLYAASPACSGSPGTSPPGPLLSSFSSSLWREVYSILSCWNRGSGRLNDIKIIFLLWKSCGHFLTKILFSIKCMERLEDFHYLAICGILDTDLFLLFLMVFRIRCLAEGV